MAGEYENWNPRPVINSTPYSYVTSQMVQDGTYAKIKALEDMQKRIGIVLYCEPSLFTIAPKSPNYDPNNPDGIGRAEDTAYTQTGKYVIENSKLCSFEGYHYVIDDIKVYNTVPNNKIVNHLKDTRELTYISKAMFPDNKINEHSIGVLITCPPNQEWTYIEVKLIKFLAKLCYDYDLTPDCIMRAFDLNKSPSPLHLLDKDKWHVFISRVQEMYIAFKDNNYNDSNFASKFTGPLGIYTDKEIRSFYFNNTNNAKEYAKKYEPDHRDIDSIVNADLSISEPTNGSFVSKNNVTFAYSSNPTIPNDTSHCNQSYDILATKATPSTLDVEPIYPDLVIPPGNNFVVVDNVTNSTIRQSNNVPLTIDEFEKRQKTFNMQDYLDASKKIEGKPLNNNDPYPVDSKIQELESHTPKVKIDEVNFKLAECNHPGSPLAGPMASNFAMVQDQLIAMSKRVERRLVKLENSMSTISRYLFRMSSRVNINCVYYGGQDVFGKYKCIRCLRADRTSDGNSMTLDQCLNCTRYEPVLGQVYAILDETGVGIAQILDDMQMGYMTKEDYIELTRNEAIINPKEYANLTNNSKETPELFNDVWDDGFKMDWSVTSLESQRPDIAEYNIEKMSARKPTLNELLQATIDNPNSEEAKKALEDYMEIINNKVTPEEGGNLAPEDEYIGIQNSETPVESIVYNSEDYKFDGFAEVVDIKIGTGNSGAKAREKIVAFAESILALAKEGKVMYSQPMRQCHDGVGLATGAVNGIHYYDCSSFVCECYRQAGIEGVGGYTGDMFPNMLPANGGMLWSLVEDYEAAIANALPGDWIFGYGSTATMPKTTQACINDTNYRNTDNGIVHTLLYIGNEETIEVTTWSTYCIKQKVKDYNCAYVIGRPNKLVELDKVQDSLIDGQDVTYTGSISVPAFDYAGLNTRQAQWLKDISVIAIRCSLKNHKIFASTCIAQSALETGWGQAIPSEGATISNNYFGIKADSSWTGKYVNCNGSKWRAYATMKDSVEDYYSFLSSNSNYEKSGVFVATTFHQQIQAIADAGYAGGSPTYVPSCTTHYNERKLGEADKMVDSIRKQELDKIAQYNSALGAPPNFLAQGFSELSLTLAQSGIDSRVNATISNMKTYGYKEILKKVCKVHNYDPYMILGIIATESNGKPDVVNNFNFAGLMQCPLYTSANGQGAYAKTDLSSIEHDIDYGCKVLTGKYNAFNSEMQKNRLMWLIAYNTGELIPMLARDAYEPANPGKKLVDQNGGIIVNECTKAACGYYGSWKYNEVMGWAPRVYLFWNKFYALKCLD